MFNVVGLAQVTGIARDLDDTRPGGHVTRIVAARERGSDRDHEVGCRAALCRAALQFDDLDAREGYLRQVSRIIPWDTGGYFHLDPHDPMRVVLYATRTPEAAFD